MGRGKVSVPEAKVQALKNYIRPKTKKDVQAFLGTTGYYRRFMKDYATHSFHLTSATKKSAPTVVEWTDMCCVLCSDCTYIDVT